VPHDAKGPFASEMDSASLTPEELVQATLQPGAAEEDIGDVAKEGLDWALQAAAAEAAEVEELVTLRCHTTAGEACIKTAAQEGKQKEVEARQARPSDIDHAAINALTAAPMRPPPPPPPKPRPAGRESRTLPGSPAAPGPHLEASARELDGHWVDRCGPIGAVRGGLLRWAHPIPGLAATRLSAEGSRVWMHVLGVYMEGAFYLEQGSISWTTGDFWWRQ